MSEQPLSQNKTLFFLMASLSSRGLHTAPPSAPGTPANFPHSSPTIPSSPSSLPLDPDDVVGRIFLHLTQISFGPDVYADADFLQKLRHALLRMSSAMTERQPTDVHIRIASSVAAEVLGSTNFSTLGKCSERRMCFEAGFILLYALRPEVQGLIVRDIKLLLKQYPEFEAEDVDEGELDLLLSYRNVMKIAQEVIPPRYNKRYLLDIVTRIAEGRNKTYVTGSGQTPATARRVLIYMRESGVTPLPRPPRRNLSPITPNEKVAGAPRRRGRKRKVVECEERVQEVIRPSPSAILSPACRKRKVECEERVQEVIRPSPLPPPPSAILSPACRKRKVECEELVQEVTGTFPLPSAPSAVLSNVSISEPFADSASCDFMLLSMEELGAEDLNFGCFSSFTAPQFSVSDVEGLLLGPLPDITVADFGLDCATTWIDYRTIPVTYDAEDAHEQTRQRMRHQ